MNIRESRKRLGLSASKLSKIIGTNTCSVYKWEQGKTSPRNKEKIFSRINALIELFDNLEKNCDFLLKGR